MEIERLRISTHFLNQNTARVEESRYIYLTALNLLKLESNLSQGMKCGLQIYNCNNLEKKPSHSHTMTTKF